MARASPTVACYRWLVPLSDSAREVLEAAVRLNPDGARALLASLLTAPSIVQRIPQDRFGPLAHMVVPEKRPAAGPMARRRLNRPMLPVELHAQAEEFQGEWLAGNITKAELAAAVVECLRQAGEEIPAHSGGWSRVAGTRNGDRDPLGRIFPSETP